MDLFMAVTVTYLAPSALNIAFVIFRVELVLDVNLDGLEQLAT